MKLKKKAGTEIISATMVGKLTKAREWESLSPLLPGETYEYLQKNIVHIERLQSIVRQEPDDGEVYAEIMERICVCDRGGFMHWEVRETDFKESTGKGA